MENREEIIIDLDEILFINRKRSDEKNNEVLTNEEKNITASDIITKF